MELKTNVTRSGTLYLPVEIRSPFGRTVRIIPNALAAVLFPDSAEYNDVLASLEVIALEIKHRMVLEGKKRERVL